MSSYEKNKNYSFKEGSNPLFPISNKKINLINYYSALKLINKIDFRNQKKDINTNTYTNIKYKKMIEKSPRFNNSKIIIKPLDFSSNANNSKILENIAKESIYKQKPHLISNKSNINFGISTTRENKNNINISSPKNILDKSQIININNINKKNIFNQQSPNVNKNIFEINESNNKSFINNIIINNSSNNINSENITNNSKINLSNIEINQPKESNVKLIFKNNNMNTPKKFKIDNSDTPIKLKRNDSQLVLTTNNQNAFKNNNIFNGHYKLSFKKQRNISDLNDILNIDNIKNFIKQELKFRNEQKKKKKVRGPEDLHFYYVSKIQEGKKIEIEFEMNKI